jgi:hypothetical protein
MVPAQLNGQTPSFCTVQRQKSKKLEHIIKAKEKEKENENETNNKINNQNSS